MQGMKGSVAMTVGRKSRVLWALNYRYNVGFSVRKGIHNREHTIREGALERARAGEGS